MLTLLTATGARPATWKLCQAMMTLQDYQGEVRWVIVDDADPAQEVTFARAGWTLEVVRPEHRWKPGHNTQALNLQAGLAVIGPDESVVVIEDDDAYLPGYLSAAARWLDQYELAGEGLARYYHIPQKIWRNCNNKTHASLCSTVIRGEALHKFRQVARQEHKFIDMTLWKEFQGAKTIYPAKYVVGIKGLPGRAGIGGGHRMTTRKDPNMTGVRDPNLTQLRSWLGQLFPLYVHSGFV